MAELQLKSHRFRTEREADWRRLETLLARAEQGAGQLSDQDLIAMPVLYRSALSSLSVARSMSLDRALVDYLESLSVRAYFFVYGSRARPLDRIARFFVHDWPAAVRGLWRETLVAGLLMVLGGVAGFLLVQQDADWFYAFMPKDLAGDRGPAASTASLRASLYDAPKQGGLSVFAAFLFTHNAQIAIFAFALGFALCLPTAMLMLQTGAMGGAFIEIYAAHDLAMQAGGWMMIHGVTELFAVTLAGAAGFRIGWSVVFPGRLTRMEAAKAAGRQSGTVMVGVVLMLMVAGGLEGIGRQVITSDLVRWLIAAGTAIFWGVYFYWPRRPALGQA